jgi:hypothetical protein
MGCGFADFRLPVKNKPIWHIQETKKGKTPGAIKYVHW